MEGGKKKKKARIAESNTFLQHWKENGYHFFLFIFLYLQTKFKTITCSIWELVVSVNESEKYSWRWYRTACSVSCGMQITGNYEVWLKSIGTTAVLKYAEWSSLAQIDLELCQACTPSYNIPLLYQCFEGKCVKCGPLTTPLLVQQFCAKRNIAQILSLAISSCSKIKCYLKGKRAQGSPRECDKAAAVYPHKK